jgi:uncharacterized membrane protein
MQPATDSPTHTSHPPRLVKAVVLIYFCAICLIGISPSKGLSIAGRVLLCASLVHAYLVTRCDVATWLVTKRNVALLFLAQLCGWLILIPVEWYAFEFANFDTGIFANNIANWRQTGRYYSSILNMHACADHFTPLLLLFSPLLSAWNSFLWLPIAKVAAWAWSIYLLCALSRDVLGVSSQFRYFVPAIYLLNQYIANSMLMEFQPSSLAIPFVILAFRLAYHERFALLLAVLIGILGFKEHLGVVWISIGLFVILEKRKIALGSSMIALGTIEGLFVYSWLMPLLAKGVVHHDSRIGPFVGVPRKITLLLKATVSFAGLPLFARYGILYALPGFVLVLMGRETSMQSFDHHYHDLGFALLACSSILGLRTLGRRSHIVGLSIPTVANALVLIVLAQAIRFPTFSIRREWPSREMVAMHNDLGTIRSYITTSSPSEVWALDHIGPYLFDQPNLRSISKPTLPPPVPGQSRRIVIISPAVKSYPLWRREYDQLRTHLQTQYHEVTSELGIASSIRVFISR